MRTSGCCVRRNAYPLRVDEFLFDVRMMIRGPFKSCPGCGERSLGVTNVGPFAVTRRCAACLELQNAPLPRLMKKVMYLDQFAISDMVKSLDPTDPAHARIHPRWIDLFSKLDRLSKLQLIVCPDSEAHVDESSLHSSSKPLRRLYEHLSHGVTFTPFSEIQARQVHAFFEAWLDEAAPPPAGPAAAVTSGDPHAWTDVIRISVDLGVDHSTEVAQRRSKVADALGPLYERWRVEQPSYADALRKEVATYPRGVMEAYVQWATRVELAQAGGFSGDWDSLIPGPAPRLVLSLMRTLESRGAPPGTRLPVVASFMRDADFSKVPFIEISSHLWASVARAAANGAKPPEASIWTDFQVISSLLPFCDAMLLDRACVGLLRDNPLRSALDKYGCRTFAPREFKDMLEFLDEIERSAAPEHLELVEDIYGPDWPTPFLEVLTYDRDGSPGPRDA